MLNLSLQILQTGAEWKHMEYMRHMIQNNLET